MKELFEEMMSGPPGFGGRRGGRGRPGGRGRHPGGRSSVPVDRQTIKSWLVGRLPQEWAVDPDGVLIDDDEVVVFVTLQDVVMPDGADEANRSTAEAARIGGFREETRQARMRIAAEGEAAFGRVFSWGAVCGSTRSPFTTASVPVMTRLRIEDRQVLDTLIAAGVARSRSDALAWCVQLVGRNEQSWISDLRAAFEQVEAVRSRGPASAGQSQ